MTYLDAIILGLVQGLTEFIPVSSSGHLVIANYLLGINDNFEFAVLLNIGTLLALVVYYRERLWDLCKRSILGKEWKLLAKLLAATIPAVIIGLSFGEFIKYLNELIWVVVVLLIIVGILMIKYGSERKGADDRELEASVTWPTVGRVGAAQAIALIPGTSRSGITILAGLWSNLSAKKAAEFSFLLAIPTILGATLKVTFLDGGASFVANSPGLFLVGNIASFVSGIWAVGFLIRLLGKRGLKDFGWYRIGLASVLIILLVTGII
jgi:undecaprenyl-diphosphatase